MPKPMTANRPAIDEPDDHIDWQEEDAVWLRDFILKRMLPICAVFLVVICAALHFTYGG